MTQQGSGGGGGGGGGDGSPGGFSTLPGGHGGGSPPAPQAVDSPAPAGPDMETLRPGQRVAPAQPPAQQQPARQPPAPQPAASPAYPQPVAPPAPPQQPPAQQPAPAYPQQPAPAPAPGQHPPQPYAPYPHGATPAPVTQPADLHGSGAGFFTISLVRAFRLEIRPDEVLPAEKAALEAARPPVREPVVQAFLAWRRSLLFIIAVFLVPVVTLAGIELFSAEEPADAVARELIGTLEGLGVVSWLSQVAFTVLCWVCLKRWTSWRGQRKALIIGWSIFFLAPFLVHLFPVRSVIDDLQGVDPAQKTQVAIAVGLIVALKAMISLAPKAISLMPGLMRAAIASKLLFPGASAPGWLMVLAAPIYALLVYVVILVPFQITGSGLFIVAVIGLIGAQIWQVRLGYKLAQPVSAQEAADLVGKARLGYLIFNGAGLLFIALGLWELAEIIDWSALGIINLLLQLVINVLALTLIITDVVVLSLERARSLADDERSAEIIAAYNSSLTNFMTADAAFQHKTGSYPQQPGPGQ